MAKRDYGKPILAGVRRLYSIYYYRCQKNNVFWKLTFEEFHKLTSKTCTYCGIPPKQKCRSYTYNGIDRVNNKMGYTIDNCVSCCVICNSIKNDYPFNISQMKRIGKVVNQMRASMKSRLK